jgi:hypothetical protein
MNRLWVRNLIGVAVAAAALATSCVVNLYPDWVGYRRTVEPQRVASLGASASVFGQTWRIGSVRRVAKLPDRPDGPSIPRGATLAVVIIERSGPATTQPCDGVLTDGRRRWRGQSSSSVVYPLDPGATEFCNKPGPLQFDFLLPADVKPNAVDVIDSSDAILLRLQF